MGDDLNKRIAKAQAELDAQKRPSGQLAEGGQGMGLGFRMAADFVAAIIVGALLGAGVDYLLHSSPWGLIVCLMIGFVTGVWNVVRAAQQANRAGAQQTAPEDKGPDGRGKGA
jgi:ATP synthase protein I